MIEDTCSHNWFYAFDTDYNYCVNCGIYKERLTSGDTKKDNPESGDLPNYDYTINNKGVI